MSPIFSKKRQPILKAVGYWKSDEENDLPDPTQLVKPGWHSELDSIVNYLRSGHKSRSWMGFSYCRFQCDTPDHEMGSLDLTDGKWLWPQGLSHYVEIHSVMLPDEFVQTMEDNNWECPMIESLPDDTQVDIAFWLKWAGKKPKSWWQLFWT